MFDKRTRLFINFNFINLYQLIKCLIFNKKNFLDKLKYFLNEKNILLSSLGRSALYDIAKLIISKTNKKTFIIAPYTIPAVIHAIRHAGGKIAYVDIDKKTGLINIEKLNKIINSDTAGVIITHLYSKNEDIQKFINSFNQKIFIIEDAAINFGAKSENKFLGTLGDFGFFSFAMVKNLNTFVGGAIYIKDNKLYKEFLENRSLKKFPFIRTLQLLITALIIKLFFNNYSYQITHYILKFVYKRKINSILKKIYPVLFHKYEEKIPEIYNYDFNWAINDVAIFQLKKINNKIKERCRKAKIYYEEINNEVCHKPKCFDGENALLEYPIILNNKDNFELHKKLMHLGYDIRHTWYINNSRNISNNDYENYSDTLIVEKKIFCLPIHENIKDHDIKKISKIINNLCKI